MRLFGKVDSSVDRYDRAEWMSPPFDLAWAAPVIGKYNVYRGTPTPDDIDWNTPVGYVLAGTGVIDLVGLGHVADTDYYYGVRAVSDSSVEEDNTTQIVRVRVDGAGDLVGPPPNDVAEAWAEPRPAGVVRVHVRYNARDQAGLATGLQIARVSGGVADWSSLLGTISIAGGGHYYHDINPAFGDGETVRLAVRAVTASGAAGGDAWAAPVTADASAPAAVSYLEGSQYV